MRTRQTLVYGIGAALLAGLAHGVLAQDAPTYYHFEVIMFTQPQSYSDEVFDLESIEPSDMRSGPYKYSTRAASKLRQTADKLAASGRFVPFYHKAWSQAGVERRKAPVVPVSDSYDNVTVDGAFRVHRDRYLYFEIDLVLDDAGGERVQIKQTRKMRSKQLHYIDHPHIGILAIAYPLS